MVSVAVVDTRQGIQSAYEKALALVGGINDLDKKPVTIKVGVFSHKKGHHYTTVDVAQAIVTTFGKAPVIYLAESDNYEGTGMERLQIYKNLFNQVTPVNLSKDTQTRKVVISDEVMQFSHILFNPYVFVSTHVLRRATIGSILKNLLGLVPDIKKARFHKNLVPPLLDAYAAIGGIDLAVLDGTYAYLESTGSEDAGVRTDVLVVGKDAVAVETVGATICGLEPETMPIIQEAVKRGFGEGDMENITVLGESLEMVAERIHQHR